VTQQTGSPAAWSILSKAWKSDSVRLKKMAREAAYLTACGLAMRRFLS
jgi:hypothetical protein